MSIPEDTPTSGEKTFTLTELEAVTGRATRDELHGAIVFWIERTYD